MQAPLAEHVSEAIVCMCRLEAMLEKLDVPNTKTETRSVHKAFSPVVKDTISHLEKASKAVFNQHIYFALSPDMFNPFNLLEIERSFSSFALNEPTRTMVLLKHVFDLDPMKEVKPAADRMGNTVSALCQYDCLNTNKLIQRSLYIQLTVHHSRRAMFSTVTLHLPLIGRDERELHKTGKEPLIANNLVRFRLLQATMPPPGKLDLDTVAKPVEGALGRISAKADICSRSWYIFVSPSPVLEFVMSTMY